MLLQDILATKGTTVLTTSPPGHTGRSRPADGRPQRRFDARLPRSLTLGERLLGIVTEHDLLRYFAGGRCD